VRFVREAGWGNAMRYMLTGEDWRADDAHRMGLVQIVTLEKRSPFMSVASRPRTLEERPRVGL
jgi:enoyl-CoA hydratase/carnithine racemase